MDGAIEEPVSMHIPLSQGECMVKELTHPLLFPSLYDNVPYPLLHLSVGGSYAYGCATANSDVDVYGIYVLPEDDVLGLKKPQERYTCPKEELGGHIVELVTYDLKKFLLLLLNDNGNGNMLELLYAPCRLYVTPEYWQLRTLVASVLTRHISIHYTKYAADEWKRIEVGIVKHERIEAKSLIHCYRLLLTGIHLMKTGRVELSIPDLTHIYLCPILTQMVKVRQDMPNDASFFFPKAALGQPENFYYQEYKRLQQVLQDSADESKLPDDRIDAEEKLNAFLLRVRKNFR